MGLFLLIAFLMAFGIMCAGILAGIFALADVGETQKKELENKAG